MTPTIVDPGLCKSVLATHWRAVLHMRQQIAAKRFGLVLGAGASVPFGFPNWTTLISRIAAHPDVKGHTLLSQPAANTSQSQLLFQHFRARQLNGLPVHDDPLNRAESRILAGWQRIVQRILYRDVPKSVKTLLKRDTYLWAFLPVIKTTPLTINYNFDDTIQRMVDATRSEEERKKKKGVATVWNANIQLLPRDGVIYHPNGYLPHSLKERPSEQLVFLEDSFADQLIDSMAGHYSALSYHLSQSTWLLLGLSLSDPTLKHLLRQSAHCFPGHYHYYIAFVSDGDKVDEQYRQTVVDANFGVYNLITLFLKANEIAALGELLQMSEEDFLHLMQEVGKPTVLRFLLTGSVAVGKSTTLSHFRTLNTHDEWLEERESGMEKDPRTLDSSAIAEIDRWVMRQLSLKNLSMIDARAGMHLVDRAPLDAFAFTKPREWPAKAKMIREAVSPGESKRTLESAHIVLLLGDPEVLAVRALSKHKEHDAASLQRQQELLRRVYGIRRQGVTVIDTRGKSVRQVVQYVARVVHQNDYMVAPLHQWLLDIERGKLRA